MKENGVGTASIEGPDRVEALLRSAESRERPSAEHEREIRTRLEAEWRAATRRRKSFRVGFAAAAAIVLVLAAALVQRGGPGPVTAPVHLARVEMTEGYARMVADRKSEAATVVPEGAELLSGQEIRTDARSRMALRWRDGSSVRVDRSARLRLTAAGGIELLQGRLYVDAAEAGAAGAVYLETPAGIVRHLGTRYMSAVDGELTRVSVREGRVQLGSASGPVAGGGQEMTVAAGGAPEFRAIATYGAEWNWTESLAPAFASDGRSIADLLDWISRETGYEVEFESAEASALAAGTALRGNVELAPMRALEAVLPTGSLTSDVHNGVISVRLATVD